jgi:hypothetical protein
MFKTSMKKVTMFFLLIISALFVFIAINSGLRESFTTGFNQARSEQ